MTDPVAPWTIHRPWRNMNPGDLRPRKGSPQWPLMVGADVSPGGPFARFGSRSDGWAALGLWLLYAHDVLGLKTTSAKIAVFAPPDDDNDTASYSAGVARKVGDDADPHNLAVMEALCKAIAHWEDYQAQWPQAEITAGLQECLKRWPLFLAGIGAPPRLGTPPPAAPASVASEADALNEAELARVKGKP